ncbi:MAG: 30S ribosomal protein S16 [Candidatus Calescibacterium sp.]|nr:30S ribosomal protein S16 [Candidatus Calescibacterium sp.]MCX7972082.1 30S ribosomal protein S16 [bacterium]MDW8194633.1 30S ribosomal protein S16 [Candidatus Calescibacterium sp.]
MLRIRLSRYGHRHNPWYRIVVADSKARRDGKFIEKIGFYNPRMNPKVLEINLERFKYWVNKGAQPTETVKKLIQRYQEKLLKK